MDKWIILYEIIMIKQTYQSSISIHLSDSHEIYILYISIEISSIATELKSNNQKVMVMIATDGESSDGNVAEALRPLTEVW